MKVYSLLVLICLTTNLLLAQDHLTPSIGFFATNGPEQEYYKLLRENLLTGLSDRPMARVIVFPSFSPEYLVALEQDHLEYYLFFRTCSKSIWSIRSMPEPLTLIEKKTEISPELGKRLNEFLFVTISHARYPPIEYISFQGQKPVMAFPMGVDGVTYRFVATMPDSDVRSGEIYSPEKGSLMARLVGVVDLMASVAKGAGKESDLAAAVEKLNKQLTGK
ncbi:hypothetical protein [uncultured Fibrella sp.]|uniref:hypothetical protein n=1 Tax=uncultured Fibrella sp. TaxID=1284596 RepID=UPI0035CA6D8A